MINNDEFEHRVALKAHMILEAMEDDDGEHTLAEMLARHLLTPPFRVGPDTIQLMIDRYTADGHVDEAATKHLCEVLRAIKEDLE